jgi:hypothetical protein
MVAFFSPHSDSKANSRAMSERSGSIARQPWP